MNGTIYGQYEQDIDDSFFFFGKPVKEENFKSLSVYVKQNQNEF